MSYHLDILFKFLGVQALYINGEATVDEPTPLQMQAAAILALSLRLVWLDIHEGWYHVPIELARRRMIQHTQDGPFPAEEATCHVVRTLAQMIACAVPRFRDLRLGFHAAPTFQRASKRDVPPTSTDSEYTTETIQEATSLCKQGRTGQFYHRTTILTDSAGKRPEVVSTLLAPFLWECRQWASSHQQPRFSLALVSRSHATLPTPSSHPILLHYASGLSSHFYIRKTTLFVPDHRPILRTYTPDFPPFYIAILRAAHAMTAKATHLCVLSCTPKSQSAIV
ncbi:hypothetical protein C8R44DRAFT_752689 [Mycena epipterygia]|nr:hypothetical protein C8R44DRAFT_752689 [Mycena epipterygia]